MPPKNSRLLLLLALSAGCDQRAADATTDVPDVATGPSCVGRDVTVLGGELYGSVQGRITATVANTACSGMPRPGGNGARLQFVHTRANDVTTRGDTMTVILGIDGLTRLATGEGLRTTVTFVDSGSARIFSSANGTSCASDVLSHEPYRAGGTTLVTGVTYCTAAIPEVNGDGNVRLPELRFSGQVHWPASESKATEE